MTRPPEDRPAPVRAVPDLEPDPPTLDCSQPCTEVDAAARAELDDLIDAGNASLDALIDSFPPEERSAAAAGMYTVSDGEVRTTYRMLRVVGSPPRRRLGPPIPDSADEEQY